MNKEILVVPSGIRYISDWKEYDLDNYQFPHILNKTITGCGFTEYCICNPMNVILLSPRKMLLENKESQHPGEVFYARNEIENTVDFERDISINKKQNFLSIFNMLFLNNNDEIIIKQKILEYHDRIKEYVLDCMRNKKPCKILVTYDSFRHVKEVLKELGILDRFYTVVDEFQSFLVDSHFKSSTELEVLFQLQDLQKVCFVSATPMLDKYLDLLEEFKDLPYFELDWETGEPGRTKKPLLDIKFTKNSLNEEIKRNIQLYQDGKFEKRLYLDPSGNPSEIESKEATIFVNSVKSIARAIINCGLTLDNTNVLCARTEENEKKIRAAFNQSLNEQGLKRLPRGTKCIGSIPGRGEAHKMFTFCTRTVYLGADFYSTNSRTFIFSDSNIDCLSVDISMDLEQILGRQRLDENPWKDSASIIIKTTRDEVTKEYFNNYLKVKINRTNNLLKAYENNSGDSGILYSLAEKYESDAKSSSYKRDYVAVNRHGGKNLIPVFNNLVLVSEQRAFDIQQIDYKNRFTVFNAISSKFSVTSDKVQEYLQKFNSTTTFPDKIKYLHDVFVLLNNPVLFDTFLSQIPQKFGDYYRVFGFERMKALKYSESLIKQEWNRIMENSQSKDELRERIYQEFQVNQSYTRSFIKEKLGKIYQELGYQETPKANQIEEYFEIKDTKLSLEGKREHGFKLINKKL